MGMESTEFDEDERTKFFEISKKGAEPNVYLYKQKFNFHGDVHGDADKSWIAQQYTKGDFQVVSEKGLKDACSTCPGPLTPGKYNCPVWDCDEHFSTFELVRAPVLHDRV